MKDKKKIIIIAITGIAILVAGILCKQEFFLMIPLFVSLFVMAFQSEANRVGPLIGSINSIIYAAAYIYMGVNSCSIGLSHKRKLQLFPP